jgi:glyoxylate/hydroxypyruvate reductase A
MGRQMAEYVLAYALHWLQGMDRREAFQARAEWQKEASLPRHLFDQDVAVLGTGAIGQEIARTLTPLCRSVTGYNSAGRKDDGFERTLPLSAFARADIVIGALPATAGTRGIIGEKILRAMSGGLLINIGRGSTLDEACLAALLQAGSLSHAVLDVFAEEPLPASHWAWSHPDVTVTPHVSGVTRPEDIAAAFNEKLPRFLNGTLRSEVDPAKGYGA